jgi:hypothetical protein
MKKVLIGKSELPGASVGERQVIRDPVGTWRYADSWVPVPGARDVTLTERFSPKFVVNGADEVERVVVDAASIKAAPDLLAWCLDAGTVLRSGEEVFEVLVPFDLWKEREQIPNELFSPEHQGDEAEREVAAAERRFREMERRFEAASRERAEVLRRYADDMTRQKAREITGLSVGRVQQLISGDSMEDVEREVLELFENGPLRSLEACVERAKAKGVPLAKKALLTRVEELKDRELLEEGDQFSVSLTNKGAAALLEAQVRGQVEDGG